jgi:hypothetical protein
MAIQKYLCEKEWLRCDVADFVRVTVYEVGSNGKFVIDITHHDSEALADEWLVKEWNIKQAGKFGEQFLFEANRLV